MPKVNVHDELWKIYNTADSFQKRLRGVMDKWDEIFDTCDWGDVYVPEEVFKKDYPRTTILSFMKIEQNWLDQHRAMPIIKIGDVPVQLVPEKQHDFEVY